MLVQPLKTMGKTKRKIVKKTTILLWVMVLFLTLSIAVIFFWKTRENRREKSDKIIYEAMVQTQGRDKYETVEERSTFLENGDVVVIYPEGHSWTDSEREKLIIKLEITAQQAQSLMEADVTETEDTKAKQDSAQALSFIAKRKKVNALRKYRIKLKDIGWNSQKTLQEQKIDGDIFNASVIEEKK